MNTALLKNSLTTAFGVLAGLPAMVLAQFPSLPLRWKEVLGIVGGVGMIGLGVMAKDFNTHSTQEEVNNSGVQK